MYLRTVSDELELTFTGGEISRTLEVPFSKVVEDLAPGRYAVAVSGIRRNYTDRDPIETPFGKFYMPETWEYDLITAAEVNRKNGESIIRAYVIWAEPGDREEKTAVYPLPEDEIGAYAVNKDGTKVYLAFHTYEICMNRPGSAELCSGPGKCFHK